jgi:DNA-binding beta-propeller fold protein YncE
VILPAGLLLLALAADPLSLEKTIPLPNVKGRIDHLSIDRSGKRLFVAALGNNTVEVLDLEHGAVLQSVPGFHEPQGVLYVPSANRLFVANGEDGTVRILDGATFKLIKSVDYGGDADNLRLEPGGGHVWVGYGSGALGELDVDGNRLQAIALDAHPESFQIEQGGSRIYVNLPKAEKITVVDGHKQTVIATWTTGGPKSNYPMAYDEASHRLYIVCRAPARLVVIDTQKGARVASMPVIGDCDDVFYDAKRKRLYAIGGEGGVSVIANRGSDRYEELGRIKTVPGARTGYYDAEADLLYVAVREGAGHGAEIRVYRPTQP